ncbi:MAG: LysM peptidoglycan-binding domain-containing protein [Marinicaulis sp.]|nr:LysM peptidoglycan-binding domain-containing protein [Marinicaulis sp.]NNL88781.1 LysM peptidoglycan-binding domain-containing protein [Marinicaulis sp.]
MRKFQMMRTAGLAILGTAAFAAITPAAAGRCGASLSVDAPTTLAKVARQCNVNLSQLYEANPGVDPSNVRPGEHLSIPDEIDRYTIGSGPSTIYGDADLPDAANGDLVDDPDLFGLEPDYTATIGDFGSSIDDDFGRNSIDRERDGAKLTRARIRVRDARLREPSNSRVWTRNERRPSVAEARDRYAAAGDRLSYQQMSAMRIQTAGQPDNFVRFASAPTIQAPSLQPRNVSATTKLIECSNLKQANGSKIRAVSKIISTPDTTFVEIKETPAGDSFDCRLIDANEVSANVNPDGTVPGVPAARFTGPKVLGSSDYRLPDYSKIGPASAPSLAPTVSRPDMVSLSGDVIASANGCLILQTNDKKIWRLAAAPPSGELLGKRVTVWGAEASAQSCGAGPSMIVSHAVYAEPWN